MVSVDGVVAVWTEQFNPSSVEYDLPPLGILPNIISTGALTITELTSPPVTIEEGQPFLDPVVLQVNDSSGYASGKLCFVYI